MPDSGLPEWARVVDQILGMAACALVVVIGVADVLVPAVTYEEVGRPSVPLGAGVAIGAGLVGLGASATRRWRWEMVAVSVMAPAILARSVVTWATVDTSVTRIAAAAAFSLAAVLLARRAVHLWAFAFKATRAVQTSRRRRR